MTINYTTAPGLSGVHYSTHVAECAKQAVYIDMPVAAIVTFGVAGALGLAAATAAAPVTLAAVATVGVGACVAALKAAALSGTGFVASCTLGRVADELTHDSDHNTEAVVAARAAGGAIKYAITASGPVTIGRVAAGALNNGLYGLASKVGDDVVSPIAIEMIDSVAGGNYILSEPGMAAGLGVSILGMVYTPTESATAFSLAKKGKCYIDCEVAKDISYNGIESCRVAAVGTSIDYTYTTTEL